MVGFLVLGFHNYLLQQDTGDIDLLGEQAHLTVVALKPPPWRTHLKTLWRRYHLPRVGEASYFLRFCLFLLVHLWAEPCILWEEAV